MVCEILSIGTELLMGQIANTDAQYISRHLAELGIMVYRQTTVGDNPARVKEALSTAVSRSDLVITTGGLGPTEDDLTKEVVAEHFGLPMELDQKSLDALQARMAAYGQPNMTSNNLKQAYFPKGAIIMENLRGTAPGCIVEQGGKAVAVLPGPPREMQDMFMRQLAPYLSGKTGIEIVSRYLRVFGVGESKAETILLDLFHSDNPTLALYCGAGEVQARLSARVERKEDAKRLLDPLEKEIRARLGSAVYGEDEDDTLAKAVMRDLIRAKKTVATAESCTAGMLASRLVDMPGASQSFQQGFITYANEAKKRLLGVSEEILSSFGAVSEPCAIAMAEGAARSCGADYALSITGIAGPGGGTEEKPVGTVYVGLYTKKGTTAQRFHILGDRSWIREISCQNALNMLRLALLEEK